MDYKNLIVEQEAGIVTLTINRPKALNALSYDTLEEIKYFFGEDGPKREALAGIIVTGSGEKSFVAGADIKEFLGLSAEEGKQLAQRGQDIFFMIERFHVPVIAAINGYALGGGCELAMACHMRIASSKAKFGQPEVNLGLIPGYGGTQRLPQLIGKGRAMELILTADLIGGQQAYQIGLVNHLVEPGEEVAKAKEILQKIATKGPVAITKSIEAVNAYYQQGADGFKAEVNAFGETTATDDFKEGAAAFVEKRAANFSGR